MTDIIEEDVTMTHIITIITTTTITAEAVSIAMMMMTTTQVWVHLRAVLRQAVQATTIRLLQVDTVQEVRQVEVQVRLPATRLLRAEEAAAALRQEVQDRITGQVDEDPDIKKTFP